MAHKKREKKIEFPEIQTIQDLSPHQKVQGYIQSVNERAGVFVDLSRTIRARIIFKEIVLPGSKKPILPSKAAEKFPVGSLIIAYVKSLDFDKNLVELTLRENAEFTKYLKFSDLKEDQILTGNVSRIERFGIFIVITNSKISGLCHASEIVDGAVETEESMKAQYHQNDLVKVKLIKIDSGNKKIFFSMKPSHFKNELDPPKKKTKIRRKKTRKERGKKRGKKSGGKKIRN